MQLIDDRLAQRDCVKFQRTRLPWISQCRRVDDIRRPVHPVALPTRSWVRNRVCAVERGAVTLIGADLSVALPMATVARLQRNAPLANHQLDRLRLRRPNVELHAPTLRSNATGKPSN